MNQSLLHLIEATKKYQPNLNEQYLEEIIQSCKQSNQNGRYLILLLIKIWTNDNEFLGYRFHQWYQIQKKDINLKNSIDLLKIGQPHQCISKYESKLSRDTFDIIRKHNFLPRENSKLQELSFKKVLDNLKMYEDPELNTISKILSRNLDTIIEVSKKDWISFVMLYVQFYDYTVTPSQMTQILNQINIWENIELENEEFIFTQIAFNPSPQLITEKLLQVDVGLSYFVFKYFEAQGPDKLRSQYEINYSKLKIIREILNDMNYDIKSENEVLFFFNEIQDILKIIKKDRNYKDIQETFSKIFVEQGENIIASCNDFIQILQFVEKLEAFDIQNSVQQILYAILKKLFDLPGLANSENALNILIEKYLYDNNLISCIQKVMNQNLQNNKFDDLFRSFIKNFSLKQYRGFFEQELMKLSFKFGLRLDDLQLVNQVENPEFLILNISQEFIKNVMQMDDQFKLKIKITLSNLLDQCQNDEDQMLENRKNIVRLLIRRL